MSFNAFSRQSFAHGLQGQAEEIYLLSWHSRARLARGAAVGLATGVLLISGVAFSSNETASNDDAVMPLAATLNPNADPDGDGLSNQFEASFNGLFNPNDRDTDHDDLRDEEEFNKRYGVTYPNVWDSDGDGLGDGQEVFGYYGYVTRPDVWDTDGDGRSDGAEIFDHNHRTRPIVFES